MGTHRAGLSTEIDRSFPLDSRAPGDARRSLTPLGGQMPPEVLIDLELLISEMVTNSVKHSGRSDQHVDVSIRARPDAVRVEVRREGDGRFEVEGELDVSNVEQLGDALWAELRAGSSVVVDLSGLAFMDSQGLRLFLQLASHAEQRGLGPVVLVNPSPAVRRILEISLPHGMPGLAVREERT